MIQMEMETHRGAARCIARLCRQQTIAAPDVVFAPGPI